MSRHNLVSISIQSSNTLFYLSLQLLGHSRGHYAPILLIAMSLVVGRRQFVSRLISDVLHVASGFDPSMTQPNHSGSLRSRSTASRFSSNISIAQSVSMHSEASSSRTSHSSRRFDSKVNSGSNGGRSIFSNFRLELKDDLRSLKELLFQPTPSTRSRPPRPPPKPRQIRHRVYEVSVPTIVSPLYVIVQITLKSSRILPLCTRTPSPLHLIGSSPLVCGTQSSLRRV